MSALSIAQLALYAALSLPVLYLIYRHGGRGFLGWGYLLAFCVLRVTGGALSINKTSSGAEIISSIGISPMLLSLDGILHEARVYRNPKLNKRLEYSFMVFFHIVIATAVAMVGIGAGGLAGTHPKPSDLSNIKVGMALLEAAWVILVLWALWTLNDRNNHKTAPTGHDGNVLLYGVLVVLVIVEIHLVYFMIAEYTQRADLNPVTGSLAIRVVLGFLPEFIAALILVGVGVPTGDVRERQKRSGRGGCSSRRRARV